MLRGRRSALIGGSGICRVHPGVEHATVRVVGQVQTSEVFWAPRRRPFAPWGRSGVGREDWVLRGRQPGLLGRCRLGSGESGTQRAAVCVLEMVLSWESRFGH